MQLLYSRKKRKDIAAGIHVSLARRIKSLVGRVGLVDKVCMTGGVSKNIKMVQLLENELGVTFQKLSMDPQLVGALGAALFARDAWRRKGLR
jgi:activator of 2-hydroxyglutaryl-CoA dehydratase